MKKQIMMLMAVLLVSATAIAVTSLPGVNSNTFHLSVSIDPENAGSVDRPERDIVAGGKATFTATANPGFGFNGWYVNGELVSTANSYQFTNIQSDMNIVAKFNSLAASVLTCSVKPGCEGMGTVTVSPEGTVSGNSHTLTTGTSVTLKATPATGHEFVRWEDGTGATVSTNSSYTFTIMNDMTLYAVFQKLENYNPDLISFPGAEGYGRFTTGGRAIDSRGSKVYYVTRLDDSNEEGTFRWACTTGDDTPRTILFKVAGTIYLTSRFSVKPNTTIAGQTAPGGGICLAGYQLKLQSNSIVRHIRFRAGDLPNKSMSMLDVENVKNIVLDHCTFAWSMEENLTMYDCDYTTVQWCIFSEGLYDSRNSKGARAYAAQWGGEHGTMHHCLISNCNNRTPRFNGVRASTNDRHVDNEFVNNVIFNWGKPNSLYGGENDKSCNGYNRTYMINNYFRPGPTTKNNTSGSRYFVGASSSNGVGQWMLKGNKFETGSKWAPTSNIWKDEVLEKVNADNLYGFVSNSSERALNLEGVGNSQATYDAYVLQDPVEWSGLVYESADEAYAKVVTQAGASLPHYDEVDARILAEAAGTIDPQFAGRTETGSLSRGMGIINSPTDITLQSHDEFVALYEGDNAADNKEIDVTCFPRLQMESYDCAVVDTDGDGLPDAYETEVGLNPNDGTDGQKLTASGYSNLEVFLNGVADGQIDATQYTKHQPEEQLSFDRIWRVCKEPTPENNVNVVTTVQEAVNLAPEGSIIMIYPGVYDEHVQIDKPNLHLMGVSKQNTIITGSRLYNDNGGSVDNNATVNVTASDVSFSSLTIRNTRKNEGQALALYTKGDRIVLTDCNLEGWQDTYRTGSRGQRHLVRNCKISGKTDFIYNDGEVFFDSDTLHVLESGYIVAPSHIAPYYGYVFRNCVVTTAKAGTATYLGRPWGDTPKVSFINTRLTDGISIYPQGWHDMGGLPIQMAEYNTTDTSGQAVDLSQRKTLFTADGKTASSKAVLGKLEADCYKLDHVLQGSDEWDADWQGFTLPAPVQTSFGGITHWRDDTGFAQGYVVTTAEGKVWFTMDPSYINAMEPITVRAFSRYGVLSEPAYFDQTTGIRATTTNAEVVSRQFYTADGRQVNRLQHGVTIVRETLSDGTTRTTKITAK